MLLLVVLIPLNFYSYYQKYKDSKQQLVKLNFQNFPSIITTGDVIFLDKDEVICGQKTVVLKNLNLVDYETIEKKEEETLFCQPK